MFKNISPVSPESNKTAKNTKLQNIYGSPKKQENVRRHEDFQQLFKKERKCLICEQ